MQHVTMGMRELDVDGDYLGRMRDSSALLGDRAALVARLDADGYLLLRGAVDRDLALVARRLVVDRLRSRHLLADVPIPDDAVAAPGAPSALLPLDGDAALTTLGGTLADLARVRPALDALLGACARGDMTMRAARHGDATPAAAPATPTGGRCREALCWLALEDIPWALGPVVVLAGSHRIAALHATRADGPAPFADRDPIRLVDAVGGRWVSEELRAGDAVVVRGDVLHATLTNTTTRYRLSQEVRWRARGPAPHHAEAHGHRNPVAARAD